LEQSTEGRRRMQRKPQDAEGCSGNHRMSTKEYCKRIPINKEALLLSDVVKRVQENMRGNTTASYFKVTDCGLAQCERHRHACQRSQDQILIKEVGFSTSKTST